MLLFSTMLDINEAMTEIDFIRLLREANQNNLSVNVIPANKIKWDKKTLENNFGDDNLSLSTKKYYNGNIMAARFEKKEPDGQWWRTDYVWNINDGKMSIRLSRVYSENSPLKKKFNPPSFIEYLIREKFIKDDNGLTMSGEPIMIGEDNIELLTNAVSGKENYRFPIVYVSKKFNDNTDPVNIDKLTEKLRGVAHLFVEEDNKTAIMIASQCEDKFTFDGAVTIYYPYNVNGMKTINRRHRNEEDQDKFIDKILSLVLDYTNSLEIPPLYTWSSVINRIEYVRRLHKTEERDKAVADANVANELVESTGDEIQDKEEWISELYKELDEKEEKIREQESKIKYLEGRVNSMEEDAKDIKNTFRLNLGEQEQYFDNEAKEIVLDALNTVLNNYKEECFRRYDIIKSIINGNEKPNNLKKRHDEVKRILKGIRTPTPPVDRDLKKLGITFYEDGGNHPKYIYHNNPRYNATLMSSGSDVRGGANLADEIIKKMF